ncbi:coiled-coil domain-containing protein 138 [Polymixia lowei]
MNESSETDLDQTVENLKRKYLERKKQLLSTEENTLGIGNTCSGAGHRTMLSPRSKYTSEEMKGYNKALRELFKAVTNPPDQLENDCSLRGSDEDLSGDFAAHHLQDTQALFTETDVTLPSCLNGSLGSQETEPMVGVAKNKWGEVQHFSNSCHPSSVVLENVYQEMMTIYEQLKAKRFGQQQWERELQERERRLEQQEQALGRLTGLEEVVHTRILDVEQKHQEEVGQLQDLLRERSKENRRLKSSFDTIKELNDSMKKQLNEISEQKNKLESQSRRMQARLDNLQRKCEHSVALKSRHNVCVKSRESSRPFKQEKTAGSSKASSKGSSGPSPPKLLGLLLDWVLEGQTFSPVAGDKGKVPDQHLPPEVLLNERCFKVLPLLAEQLHQTPSSEPLLLLNLLRLIYWALRHLDSSTQHVSLPSTLRRIGEVVSKPSAQSSLDQSEDPDHLLKPSGTGPPLYQSPCPHTRILSTLIILRTLTQADVLAQVLDSLRCQLVCEESRGLFLHYGGVCVLVSLLRAGRGGLHILTDILVQLTTQSRFLAPFLEACSCEEFLRTVSQLLKNPRLERPSLEKLSILLQKLSNIRKNRRLFELSSLHLQLQELHRTSDPTHTFLCLNLSAILLNLK